MRCSTLSIAMSSVYRAAPVTIARPNGLLRLAPQGLAGHVLLRLDDAVNGVIDGAVSGAPAQVAFQHAGQLVLGLTREAGRRHDHAGRAEAALERLGVEEGLLHRMELAIHGQPLDRRHLRVGRAEGRHQAAMDRGAVDPHRARAAVALIAPLLDAEPAELTQEGAQTLARTRLGGEALPVDGDVHRAQLLADLLAEVVREVTPVGRRAVHVVEVQRVRDAGVQRRAQLVGRGRPLEPELHGPRGRGGDRQEDGARPGCARADQQHRRASEMRQGGPAERERLAQGLGRQMDAPQQLAGTEHVSMVAGDEVGGGHLTRAPPRGHSVYVPSRATVSEIMGPAGNDMQMLPPTVAAFQILKEARNARQHSRSSGAAFQPAGALNRSSSAIVQVAAISSPVVGRLQGRPVQRAKIDEGIGLHLRLGEQPGAAGQPGIALVPPVDLVRRRGALDIGDRVQVHRVLRPGR